MQTGNVSPTMTISTVLHDGVLAGNARPVADAGDRSWIVAALQKPVQFAIKRAIDISVSAVALAVLMPLFLVVAAAIKYENPGPVLFTQLRWGRGGKLIKIFKFRSMRSDLCDQSGVAQTVENDPRVTRIGALLRKTNLDEMPQLINILIGDMSLVGPRCHVPGMIAAGKLYEDAVDGYHLRHLVRPGLTGLAQVNGFRGPTDREDQAVGRFTHDLDYVRNFSVFMDIRILVGTVINEVRGGTGF